MAVKPQPAPTQSPEPIPHPAPKSVDPVPRGPLVPSEEKPLS